MCYFHYNICFLNKLVYIKGVVKWHWLITFVPGTDLPVCRTEEEQCCSAEYLEEAEERVEKKLERSLRREFEDVIDSYEDEVDNLLDCESCIMIEHLFMYVGMQQFFVIL